MSTRVGVLVKDGHPSWPPRLPDGCDATLIHASTADELKKKTETLDALVWVPGVSSEEVTAAFDACKPHWVHSFPAGVDGLSGFLASASLAARPVPVTNGRGAFSSSLAEYALTAILHFTKQVPRCLGNARSQTWEPFVMDVVRGKTVGFVGYGHIAQATAALCKALGMRVVACRRSCGADDTVAPAATYAPEDRSKLFAESDYVICSLPGTSATLDFCGAAEFGAMRPNAVFVSLGRGAAVDEDALVDALKAGKLRGAALDVFKEEPLPQTFAPASALSFLRRRRRGGTPPTLDTQVAALGPRRPRAPHGAQRGPHGGLLRPGLERLRGKLPVLRRGRNAVGDAY